jgi:hypothetical protein
MDKLSQHKPLIHPELYSFVEADFDKGSYDSAIFEGCKFLEIKLQAVGNTKSINTALVDQLFTNAALVISNDEHRNMWAKELFLGLMRLIRNDRWHNKTMDESIEIKCETPENCLQYLCFISLLLFYTDRNLARKPELYLMIFSDLL